MREYAEFLESKRSLVLPCGFDVKAESLNPHLFEWQRDCVVWALKRGKAALFESTGLGKTLQLLVWAHEVCGFTGGNVLVLSPLAVAQQTCREGARFGIETHLCRSQADVRPGINVTNYDMMEHFDLESFAGVVLDESGCIKDWTSKTTKTLTERLKNTRFKLCCTATPSPNDHMELGTHAELLDAMTRTEMLSMFFCHDGGDTSKWRLKGHAAKPFWKWIASWAIALQLPSDLGYPDDGYILPPLNMQEHVVPVDHSVETDGMLFRCPDLSATGLHKELRLTAEDRARKVAELVAAKPDEPWLLWCNTNYEAESVLRHVPDVVEVRGSDSFPKKEGRLVEFSEGRLKRLLSKPSICGHGMNWQHCANMAFVGIGYSFEQVYQAVRRCWRYGQTRPVFAHIVIAETEGKILESLQRKEQQHEQLQVEMNAAMRVEQLKARHVKSNYEHAEPMEIPSWLREEVA